MRVITTAAIFALILVLSGCAAGTDTMGSGNYARITATEAKEIMDSSEEVIILDVRTQEEYDSGHIEGAVLLPYDMIDMLAEEMLPDKDAKILVYCRSGNRSRTAAYSLLALGYTNVLDFGGIINWPYDVVLD